MSMLFRWVITLAIIGLAAMLGMWVADHPGSLQLDWMGYRISTSFWLLFAALLVVIALGFMAIWIVLKLVYGISLFGKKREIRSYDRGLTAITRTINAMSLKDFSDAKKQLKQARSLLGDDAPLLTLLEAHIASKTGNETLLLESLDNMRAHDETKHVALSSLTRIANDKHDVAKAIDYAREAYQMQPSHTESALHYLHLLLQSGKYAAAHAVVQEAMRYKSFDKAQQQRFKAVINYVHYRDSGALTMVPQTLGTMNDARDSVITHEPEADIALLAKSFASDMTFSPAYQYIIAHHEAGKARTSLKALLNAWKAAPHPELADILLHYFADGAPEKLMKRARTMVKMWPDHIESHVLMAQVCLQADEWDKARNHLKAALSLSPQMRVFKLLSQLEERHGHDDDAASTWLKRMQDAEPNPAWSCTQCGHVSPHWAMQCHACNHFDGYRWGAIAHHGAEKVDSDRGAVAAITSGL